jgi:hypothetical protein
LSCASALTVPETAGGLPAALTELLDPRARRRVRHGCRSGEGRDLRDAATTADACTAGVSTSLTSPNGAAHRLLGNRFPNQHFHHAQKLRPEKV